MKNVHRSLSRKILDVNTLDAYVYGQKLKNQRIVFTNGCFDLLHNGHLSYLMEASNLGDILLVGLNSDESIKRIKGLNRPIQNQNDRATLLASLFYVDAICVFEEDTPVNLIKTVKPDVLVKGGDYKKKEIVGQDIVLNMGGEVKVLNFEKGYSTSTLIARLKKIAI